METMAFGAFALTVLTVSALLIYNKKYLCGICGSIAAIILTSFSGLSWRKMLIDSGKDTALLGFRSYPAALVILMLLLVCAMIVLLVSLVKLARKKSF